LVQLGSAGTLDEKKFMARCAMLSIRTCVPVALRAAATRFKGEKRDALLEAANRCEAEPTLENAWRAWKAVANANATANATADAAYAAAADAASYAVASYAAYTYAAVVNVVNAANAANAASAAAAAVAADAAVADKVLSDFAEGVVQILIDMDVPGVQWLSLTETVTPYFARLS
jgi:hypothetical protein